MQGMIKSIVGVALTAAAVVIPAYAADAPAAAPAAAAPAAPAAPSATPAPAADAASKPATLTPQQQKMKTCNATAKTKALTGDDRKAFMKTCLSKKGAAAPSASAPAAPKPAQ